MALYLHVGPHKTGSTYLQNSFVANTKSLGAAGIVYPDIARGIYDGHHALVYEREKYLNADAAEPAHKELVKLLETNENLLFSAEGLATWSSQSFDRLSRLASGHSMKIIYILRDPYDTIYSFWKEQIKQGSVTNFNDFLLTHMAHPQNSRLLNPVRDLMRYSRMESDFELDLFLYDASRMQSLDLFESVCKESLGVTSINKIFKTPNRSHSIELTDFLRHLNAHYFEKYQIKGATVRNSLYGLRSRGLFEEVEELYLKELSGQRKKLALSRQTRHYKWLANTIVNRFDDERKTQVDSPEKVFPEGDCVISYYDKWDVFQSAKLRELFEKVVGLLDKKLL